MYQQLKGKLGAGKKATKGVAQLRAKAGSRPTGPMAVRPKKRGL